MMLVSRVLRPSVVVSTITKRPFFASSTDHTQLLAEAEVHCIPKDAGMKQYVLTANGMDLDTVQKVPQLHLARLVLDGKKIHGAKVVNRTLGDPKHVCPRLLEAALKDVGPGAEAWSTLHGLSEWVAAAASAAKVGGDAPPDALQGMDKVQVDILQGIASGKGLEYDEKGWEMVAVEFVNKGLGSESNLYMERQGKLDRIEHMADVSEFADTSGGAMAVFKFS
jgi:hypothetical protein